MVMTPASTWTRISGMLPVETGVIAVGVFMVFSD
jgi:hypothetical protein